MRSVGRKHEYSEGASTRGSTAGMEVHRLVIDGGGCFRDRLALVHIVTDGVDERPALLRPVVRRSRPGPPKLDDLHQGCDAERATLETRAERAERALLGTWVMQEPPGRLGCVHCVAGPQVVVKDFAHAPGCIIPELMERYGG